MVCIALTLGAILGACADIPDEPSEKGKVSSVSIAIEQRGEQDSTTFKINSNDTAQIIALVHPDKYAKDLHYYWYREDEILDSGRTYPVEFMIYNFIPDRLVVKDDEGNSLETSFDIILNAPPRIGSDIVPADSQVFKQDINTAVLFQWYTYDSDKGDEVYSTLILDGAEFEVGDLTRIQESGFDQGVHTFQIIVTDRNGDQDSSEVRRFFIESEEP